MKSLIPVIAILVSWPAWARDMNILCKSDIGLQACVDRVTASMERLNCSLKTHVECAIYEHDARLEMCTVSAAQCNEPQPGNFGGYSCFRGNKQRLGGGLSLTWSTGFLQRYVRDICAP